MGVSVPVFTSIHNETQFLPERNLRPTWEFYILYILSFHRDKYAVNIQVQYHIDEHSNLRTLAKYALFKHYKEMWDGLTSNRRNVRLNFNLYFFCAFWYNFVETMLELANYFNSIIAKDK